MKLLKQYLEKVFQVSVAEMAPLIDKTGSCLQHQGQERTLLRACLLVLERLLLSDFDLLLVSIPACTLVFLFPGRLCANDDVHAEQPLSRDSSQGP